MDTSVYITYSTQWLTYSVMLKQPQQQRQQKCHKIVGFNMTNIHHHDLLSLKSLFFAVCTNVFFFEWNFLKLIHGSSRVNLLLSDVRGQILELMMRMTVLLPSAVTRRHFTFKVWRKSVPAFE